MKTRGARAIICFYLALSISAFGTACSKAPPTQSASEAPPTESASKVPPTQSASREVAGSGGEGWGLMASNTGLASRGLVCSELPVYTGSARPAAGTIISEKRITTAMVLSAGDITIERSCIQPKDVGQGLPLLGTTDNDSGQIAKSTVIIRDSEIDGSLLSAYDAAWTTGFIGIADLQNNYIHDVGSGIALMNTGRQLSSSIEGNYVNNLSRWGDAATTGNHSDAMTVRDFDASSSPGRKLLIKNNRLDCDSGNDTGALFIQTYSGDINNVLIEGNLFEGDGYQLGLEARFGNDYSNMQAINNRFSGTGWGATYKTGGPGWTTWKDNFVHDQSQPTAQGKSIPDP